MHGSELSPLAAPPISIPCGGCRNEMRLASVDPTNEKTVLHIPMRQRTPTPILYDRSHLNWRTADGATNSRIIATGALGNLQRRSEQPHAARVYGTERLAHNLSGARVAAARRADEMMGCGARWRA